MPNKSLVLAVEVCDAPQGEYRISVDERGSAPYLLSVGGNANPGTETGEYLLLHHISKDGFTRHYTFRFRIEEGHVILRWLDADGREQSKIENNDW
jgi:hypothetical protein